MSTTRGIGPAITITGTSLLVGCSGNGPSCGSFGSYGSYGSYGSCQQFYPAGAAGIYTGSLRSTTYPQGTPVVAIISENGDGRMSGADGSYYRINVASDGSALNGSFIAYSQDNTPLANGAQAATGTVSGTLSATSLQATLTDPTDAQQELTMAPDSVYETSSSLATLAGNWTYSAYGFSLTTNIQMSGAFTGSDSNGCTYSGTFSLIDPTFNAYAEAHVRSCNGVNATFKGLAAFFPGSSSASTQLKVLSDDGTGNYLAAEFE